MMPMIQDPALAALPSLKDVLALEKTAHAPAEIAEALTRLADVVKAVDAKEAAQVRDFVPLGSVPCPDNMAEHDRLRRVYACKHFRARIEECIDRLRLRSAGADRRSFQMSGEER